MLKKIIKTAVCVVVNDKLSGVQKSIISDVLKMVDKK